MNDISGDIEKVFLDILELYVKCARRVGVKRAKKFFREAIREWEETTDWAENVLEEQKGETETVTCNKCE